jgi:hypothetical protein
MRIKKWLMCVSVWLLRGLVDCAIRYPCVLGRTRGKAGKRAYASSRIIQDGRTHADGCAWTLRAYTQGCCMRARPIARGCGGASACACACAWAWAIHAYMHCTALHCTHAYMRINAIDFAPDLAPAQLRATARARMQPCVQARNGHANAHAQVRACNVNEIITRTIPQANAHSHSRTRALARAHAECTQT